MTVQPLEFWNGAGRWTNVKICLGSFLKCPAAAAAATTITTTTTTTTTTTSAWPQ